MNVIELGMSPNASNALNASSGSTKPGLDKMRAVKSAVAPASSPPSMSGFMKGWKAFSDSIPGTVIGNEMFKSWGGALIGIGIFSSAAGGVGVPLIIIGVVLVALSTISSMGSVADLGLGRMFVEAMCSFMTAACGMLIACAVAGIVGS